MPSKSKKQRRFFGDIRAVQDKRHLVLIFSINDDLSVAQRTADAVRTGRGDGRWSGRWTVPEGRWAPVPARD